MRIKVDSTAAAVHSLMGNLESLMMLRAIHANIVMWTKQKKKRAQKKRNIHILHFSDDFCCIAKDTDTQSHTTFFRFESVFPLASCVRIVLCLVFFFSSAIHTYKLIFNLKIMLFFFSCYCSYRFVPFLCECVCVAIHHYRTFDKDTLDAFMFRLTRIKSFVTHLNLFERHIM